MTSAPTIQGFRFDAGLLRPLNPPRPRLLGAQGLRPGPRLAMALLLLAGLMWGGGNIACKTVLTHVGPLTTLGCRCTLALLVLLACLRLERGARPNPRFALSACGVALLFAAAVLLQQYAYRWTSVTNASFLVNTCAVLTPVVAWVWLGQRPGRTVALAAGAILLGAFLMSGMAGQGASLNPGDLACLASALFYAGAMVALGHHLARHGRPLLTTAFQFAVTAALAAPLALAVEAPGVADIAAAWRELIYLGVFSTAGASVLMACAQSRVTASVAATLTSSESVFGAAAAALVLGERVPAAAAFGALVILAAILAVARKGGAR